MDAPPADWLERVAESLCEHEERHDTLRNFPPRYEVLDEISRGGMGIVYRAWDPQLGRSVALKVLRSEDGSAAAEAHERFQREARLAASLHHPNIVPIYDTGTWNGQDYIAMQLIEGRTLDRAKPDRRQALAFVRDAARALQHAHEQGIVHRDIKPSNLMVDGQGRVFVADFGIARHAVATAGMTSPGTVVGTPAYMSPEQAQGLPADARSDVYSLGATLYELLTGRAPYIGEVGDVVDAVRTKDPDSARRLVTDLSKNVEAILAGAMERRPQDRYPTAAALADDIDRYLAGERPLRRPRGLSYKVRREFVRHPWRSAASILLCVLLLGAVAVCGSVARAYGFLVKARRETIPELKQAYYKASTTWFPDQAEEGFRAIDAEERRQADHFQRLRDQRHIRAEEKKSLAVIAASKDEKEKIQRELDQSARDAQVATDYSAVLKALNEEEVAGAISALKRLETTDRQKYLELRPKVLTLQFNQGVRELIKLAAAGAETGFSLIYESLSADHYGIISDRNVRLYNPVFTLAVTLKSRHKLREALHWFDAAARLVVPDATFYKERGVTLVALQEWPRAQKDFDGLLRSNPDQADLPAPFAELPYNKGHQALLEKNWNDAVTQFTIALRIDPRLAKAWHDFGVARFRSAGLAKLALEKDLKTALGLSPDLLLDPQYREIVVSYSRAQAEEFWKVEDAGKRQSAWKSSLTWLTEIGRRLGDDPSLQIEKATMNRRLGAYDEALSALRGVPDSADKRRIEGQSRFEKAFQLGGDAEILAAALGDFIHSVQLDPKDPLLLYWRGTCHHALRDKVKALEDLKTAKTLGLDSADLHYQLSLLHQGSKDFAAAIEEAGLALARTESLTEDGYIANLYEQRNLSRRDAVRLLECDILYSRASARFSSADFKACADDCNRMIRFDPKNYSAHILRGEAACHDKRHRDAQKDYDEALSIAVSKEDRDRASRLKGNCVNHP